MLEGKKDNAKFGELMSIMKMAKCDIKMRQKMPTFAETGSCFDATNIAGIKVCWNIA